VFYQQNYFPCSETKRPIYRAAAQKKQIEEVTIASAMSSNFSANEKVPRDSDGELIVKRREIHSGRALSVATGKHFTHNCLNTNGWLAASKPLTFSSILNFAIFS